LDRALAFDSALHRLFYLEKEIDYLLFLDADEIVEGKRFAEWLANEHANTMPFGFSPTNTGQRRIAKASGSADGPSHQRNASSPLQIFSAQERFWTFRITVRA